MKLFGNPKVVVKVPDGKGGWIEETKQQKENRELIEGLASFNEAEGHGASMSFWDKLLRFQETFSESQSTSQRQKLSKSQKPTVTPKSKRFRTRAEPAQNGINMNNAVSSGGEKSVTTRKQDTTCNYEPTLDSDGYPVPQWDGYSG